jgi:hypothetical protein
MAALCCTGSLLMWSTGHAAAPTTPPPRSVESLLASIGINSAVSFPWTSYYNRIPKVISALKYLGISTLRDYTPAAPGSKNWNDCAHLAAAGIRFDFLIHGDGKVDITREVSHLDSFAQAYPGSIAAIEGPNEINDWRITYRGITDSTAAGVQVTQDLWTAVRRVPALANVPVYALTMSNGIPTIEQDESRLGKLDPYVSFSNAHVYGSGGNNAWKRDMPYWLPVQQRSTPGLPVVVTETGYGTVIKPGTDNVDEIVAAKYNLNTLFDNALNGIAATYFYELVDSPTSPHSYGFFNADWTPKAGADALHNLTDILRRGGAGEPGGNLLHSWRGLPATAHAALFASRSVFNIVVWNDVTIWDKASGKPRPAPDSIVQLNFATPVPGVRIYDPLVNAAPLVGYGRTTTIEFVLTDHPVIIQVAADPPASTVP